MIKKNERNLTQDLTPDQWELKIAHLIFDRLNAFFNPVHFTIPDLSQTQYDDIFKDCTRKVCEQYGPKPDPKKPTPLTKDQWQLQFSELLIVNLTKFLYISPTPDRPILSLTKFCSILLDATYSMKINYGPRPEEKK